MTTMIQTRWATKEGALVVSATYTEATWQQRKRLILSRGGSVMSEKPITHAEAMEELKKQQQA